MTQEAAAADILPEQEPDLSAISPEIIAAGGRLGMTAAGIAGMHLLEPNAIQRYEGRQQPMTDEERAAFDRIGILAYEADEFTQGIISHLWNCRYGVLAIDAAVGICTTPALSFLRNKTDVEYLSRHMSMHGSGEVVGANLRALTALAEAGALQHLYSGGSQNHTSQGGAVTLHNWSKTYPPAEEYAAYCARRDLLTGIARDPRFMRYAASEFGASTMHSFVSRFVHMGKNSDERTQEFTESFLTFISNDQNAANLDRIAANHPALVDFLNPITSDYSSPHMAQYCQELTEAKPGTLSPRVMGMIGTDKSAEEKMLLARVCADTIVHNLGNDWETMRAFREAALPWILTGAETAERKQALLKDPVFVRGMVRAGSRAVTDRIERSSNISSSEPIAGLIEGFYGVGSEKVRELQFIHPRLDDIFKTASTLFRDFYDKFGLDCYELLERWEEAGLSKDQKRLLVRDNVTTMLMIEEDAPGQGVCRWLRQERQIRQFERYGATVLLRQWRLRDDLTKDSGIGLYATSDLNTALRANASKYLPNVIDQLDGSDVTLRLYEAASPREALIALSRARRRYGSSHVGYGAVHGFEKIDGTHWGSGSNEASYPEDLFVRDADGTYHLPQSNLKGLGAVFVPGAPVAASTCYGAREGQLPAITRGWAIATGARMHSTVQSAKLPDVEIRRRPDGGLDMETRFKSGDLDIPTVVFDGQELRERPDPQSNFVFEVPRAVDSDKTIALIKEVIMTMTVHEVA